MRWFDAVAVMALGWPGAVDALRGPLLAGLDPDAEPARIAVPFGSGEILVMMSGTSSYAGVKLATVGTANPDRNIPRIQAVYVLFDAQTLTPLAILDGTALTALRTPAVSALGVDLLAPPNVRRLLVFGTGPQAYGHVHALRAVRPVESVRVVARDAGRTAEFVQRLRAEGIDAEPATAAAVADADLVACCTTAREPVFDGRDLPDKAVVVACGSHEPAAREIDSDTVRRCGAAVESKAVACTEAGDVIQAEAEGAIARKDLVTLAQLARGETDSRPRLIKTVGMGWEDLAVAAAIYERSA